MILGAMVAIHNANARKQARVEQEAKASRAVVYVTRDGRGRAVSSR